jgi:hypothetical protein
MHRRSSLWPTVVVRRPDAVVMIIYAGIFIELCMCGAMELLCPTLLVWITLRPSSMP